MVKKREKKEKKRRHGSCFCFLPPAGLWCSLLKKKKISKLWLWLLLFCAWWSASVKLWTCASCGTSPVGMSDMRIMGHKCMIMLGGDLFLLFIGEERTNMVTPWGAQICSQNKNKKLVYVLKEQPYRSCKWNCLHTVCFGFWNTFRH